MHLLEQVGGWIESLIAAIGYPGIVLAMALENIFPPIPSEAVLPFAGALSAKGEMNFWGAVAAGTVGSLIGAVALYAIGYFAREAGVRADSGSVWEVRAHLREGPGSRGGVVRAVRRSYHLLRAAHPYHPQHNLGAGGVHPDEHGAVSHLYHAWDDGVESDTDLRRLDPGRELGGHKRVDGSI